MAMAWRAGLAVCTVAAVVSTGSKPIEGGDRQSGAAPRETVFFDDFLGPELDRAKWNVEVTGRTVNNEQQAYIDSTDTVSVVSGEAAESANGALAIRPIHRPGFKTSDGRTFDFVSGRVNTQGKVEITSGTVAARIKLPEGGGLWPAFWALGTGKWPATGEIDIMENVGQADWTSVAVHGPGYFGATPFVRRAPLAAGNDATSWHVYAVEWGPDDLAFTLDGTRVYRVTRPMVAKYGPWAFDNPKYLIVNLALGGDYPRAVNGAAKPYPGLAPATVELLKTGRPQMLVDWVRVTKP